MKIKIFSTIIILLIAISIYATQSIRTYQGFVFGTYYSIKLKGTDVNKTDIESVFNDVNHKMSIFNKDSEINLINHNKEAIVSDELIKVLTASQKVYEQSHGAFDVSVGELIELWGFGVNHNNKVPSKNQIAEVLSYTGFNKIKIIGNLVVKENIKTKINLSAIAKGYAVDKVAQMLDENGVKSYLIDIGGEIKAKGKKGAGKSWRIGLANPENASKNQQVFDLNNMAVATSGNYENYFVKDGKKYSHTINSKTGQASLNDLASVSVFHKSCMMADAYATAIMALGYKDGNSFAKKHNLNVILIKG